MVGSVGFGPNKQAAPKSFHIKSPKFLEDGPGLSQVFSVCVFF